MALTFWAAAALSAVAGVTPFVLGGTSSRIDGAIVPFWIAAVVLGACALLPRQNRSVPALLVFIAGLAIVYALLSMFSLPVRLAVVGTCSVPPDPCPVGLERPLTNGENMGMGVATALGILAIFVGFFGLVTVYRRLALAPAPPPVRKIPPVAPPIPAKPAPPAAVEPEPETGEAAPPLDEEELPELPPHESSSATT